jgi:solute carrier family 13 (sodium-dependent dicarboxylate transporter), member 2/3/5
VALPIVVVMFVALLVVILWLNRPEVKRVEGVEEFIAEEKGKLGRVSKGERNTLIAFGVAITLWTLPGLVGLFLGDDSSLYEGLTDRWLDEGVVAVLAAGLLFVLPIDWAGGSSPSTGTRPRGSTGAPSSCSAPGSPSAG